MKLLYDYFYRFPQQRLQAPGRCRVRIYKRNNGTHTVLLTELDTNTGESIAGACDRIATDLVATRGLNPKTTRWIQHEPAFEDIPEQFEEILFTWDDARRADTPQWNRLTPAQVETLTGASLAEIGRQLGAADVHAPESMAGGGHDR